MQASPELLIGSMIGLLGTALYGLSVVVYRSQAKEIGPVAASSIKMWVALPLMAFMVILLPGIDSIFLPVATLTFLATSAILGAVIGDTVYLWSQERIGVSYAFPIAMSFPIITYLLTIVFLGESPILSRLAGVIIAVLGVILLSNEQNRNEKDDDAPRRFDLWGIAGALLTSVLYAVGIIALQVGIEGVDPISGNLVRVLFGSIAFIPLFAVAKHQGMKRPTSRSVALVSIAGFFGMGVGSLFFVTAVASVGATIMSVISSTAPLFAIPISVLILKERLTPLAVLGIIATLLGVVLVVLGF